MADWEPEARGMRDAATILPVVAAVLLLPPVILVFSASVTLGGVPLIVIYVFGVWAAVILAAWLLARHQARVPDGAGDSAEIAATGEPLGRGRR